MLILYFIPFMAVIALAVEGALDGRSRERRPDLRQYPEKTPRKRRGLFRR